MNGFASTGRPGSQSESELKLGYLSERFDFELQLLFGKWIICSSAELKIPWWGAPNEITSFLC